MLLIHSFVNNPIPSNCYLLYDKSIGKDCIIIDPGSKDEGELLVFLDNEDLSPKFIILTHEHFDHCWGANFLVERYQLPIICSELCIDAIKDEKRNCSVFYDNQEGFTINSETISIESIHNSISFGNTEAKFLPTPGHTAASICIVVGGYLFTGDTLIKNEKTVTKLPTGSVESVKRSMALLEELKGNELVVYPGHGDLFELDNYNLNDCW